MARGREEKAKGSASKGFEIAPFPPLRVSAEEWAGRDELESWAGSYKSRTGAVDVTVMLPDEVENVRKTPPLPEQVAAYGHLKQNQGEIATAILEALFKDYAELREACQADEVEQDKAEFWMPPVKAPGEVKQLIGPASVYVMPLGKGGAAYLGISFHCSWEREHGFGVMTHKSRVLKIGHADVAFNYFIAEEDGGEPLEVP